MRRDSAQLKMIQLRTMRESGDDSLTRLHGSVSLMKRFVYLGVSENG